MAIDDAVISFLGCVYAYTISKRRHCCGAVDFRTSSRTFLTRRPLCWRNCIVSTPTWCPAVVVTSAATTIRPTSTASCCQNCSTSASRPVRCETFGSRPSFADCGVTWRPDTSRTCSSRRVRRMTRLLRTGWRSRSVVPWSTRPQCRQPRWTDLQPTHSTFHHRLRRDVLYSHTLTERLLQVECSFYWLLQL